MRRCYGSGATSTGVDSHTGGWANRTGEYSPDYYAYHGPNETSERLRALFAERLGRDASVLEVGSSAGRHLAHLEAAGFHDLTGVEVNTDAVRAMRETYPDLARVATVHATRVGDVIREFADGAFDAVFTVETLQHLPPDSAWVFDELARVTDELLVTVENEGSVTGDETGVTYVNDEIPLYYRDWSHVFRAAGLELVETEVGERDTWRVFSARAAASDDSDD